MVIKDLIKKIKSFTSSRWFESTAPFIIEAVTYIDKNKLDIDSLDGQNSLKKYLYENDRAFIWDNMISRDQDAKDIIKLDSNILLGSVFYFTTILLRN